MAKALPTMCSAIKFTVCSKHHVHLEMLCDGEPVAEIIYTIDDAMALRNLVDRAIDVAVGEA